MNKFTNLFFKYKVYVICNHQLKSFLREVFAIFNTIHNLAEEINKELYLSTMTLVRGVLIWKTGVYK